MRLNPCTIELSHLNKARILAKKKSGRKLCNTESDDVMTSLNVLVTTIKNYEECSGVKEQLLNKCINIGSITVDRTCDLRHVRPKINKFGEDIKNGNADQNIKLGKDWTFVDCVTATNYFRVDKTIENKYFLIDVCDKELVIVDGDVSGEAVDNMIDKEMKENDSKESMEDRNPTFHIPIPVYKNTAGLLEKNTEAVLRAARLGDLGMMTDLYQDGFSLMAIDETAKTALHYGARFGNKDVVKFLLQNAPHSIIDIVDNEKGQTALHKAAAYQRSDICCLLVTAGASLLVKDNENRSARMLAMDSGAEQSLLTYLENQE